MPNVIPMGGGDSARAFLDRWTGTNSDIGVVQEEATMTADGDPEVPDWAVAFAQYREAFEERCTRLEEELNWMEAKVQRMRQELQPILQQQLERGDALPPKAA